MTGRTEVGTDTAVLRLDGMIGEEEEAEEGSVETRVGMEDADEGEGVRDAAPPRREQYRSKRDP